MVAPRCGGPSSGGDRAKDAREGKTVLYGHAATHYCEALLLSGCGCRTCTIGVVYKTLLAHAAILTGEALVDERITADFLAELVCTLCEKVRLLKEKYPDLNLPDFQKYEPKKDGGK